MQRCFFIAAIVLSAVIPMLSIPVLPAKPAAAETGAALNIVTQLAEVKVEAIREGSGGRSSPIPIVTIIYGVVVAAGLGFMLSNIGRVAAIRRTAKSIEIDGRTVYVSEKVKSPFAFGKSIYLCGDLDGRELAQIIAHESSHIKHGHPQERLLTNFVCLLCWFNPFSWVLLRKMCETHEFEADRDVLDEGYDLRGYRELILKQILGYCPEITSGFNNSLTKKRFIMMTRITKPGNGLLRAAVSLCVVGGLVLGFGCDRKKSQPELSESIETVATQEADVREIETADNGADSDKSAEKSETFTFVVPEIVDERTASQKSKDDQPIRNPEQVAGFPGGEEALYKFLSENLHYPQEAADNGISGWVFVEFVVEKDGTITDVQVVRSVEESLDKAAVDVVKAMPKWIPAKSEGASIRSYFTIPIIFKLSAD